MSFKKMFVLIFCMFFNTVLAQTDVLVDITTEHASIENGQLSIVFDLSDGTYSGIDKSDNTMVFKDAWYRVGQGGWLEPEYQYKAEHLDGAVDKFGEYEILRVWYMPQDSYDPNRFLDISVYKDQPFFVIGWGVHNNKDYALRARSAEVLLNGVLFEDQKCSEPRVLRGGAGGEPNFVESTWEINAHNSAMLTYLDNLAGNKRRTIVAGGLEYAEFMRTAEFHKKEKGRRTRVNNDSQIQKESFITLTIHDPQGKRIEPGEIWESKDSYFVDITTVDPFESLERFGRSLALANNANPNAYDFPTLCGWYATESYSQLKIPEELNNTPGLVGQMQFAIDKGITKYTPVALRLVPDFYCYTMEGNTQQGWWDDEHWGKYGNFFQEPYETFSKFGSKINSMGGIVINYVQTSMPSNDFALAHPDWMLNDDISLLYEDHPHARPFIRLDYTNPEFQDYTLKMWQRLRKDGVNGIMFDYPHTGWPKDGGFEDKTYTTVSAYRKIYELTRQGLGNDAYIHERIIGFPSHGVPRTDCTAGLVDVQRVWADASHFEPEMASRIGLRWYKQGVAFRYYPDAKSFYYKGEPLEKFKRQTLLTLVGLLSGRIEMASSFGTLTEEMAYDLTRFYPILPNGKSFRPVDLLLEKKHPEVYVYDVNEKWKQVILVNNETENPRMAGKRKTISAPVSGNQANTGSLGLDPESSYYVFDFWNQKPLGIVAGTEFLSADLLSGETLVYSVRKVENHPQIIGTNRHVMCGMMELGESNWNPRRKKLDFSAALVGGEAMIITIAMPGEGAYKAIEIQSDSADVSYKQNGQYVLVSAFSVENTSSKIEVFFK